jgi:hypothetical protein
LVTRKVAFSMRMRAPARSSMPEAEITDRLLGWGPLARAESRAWGEGGGMGG